MKLKSPSFKLKNSDRIVFSSSGKLLAQKASSGTKISIWDVASRSLIAQHKIISNDDYIDFLPDEEMMFVKNKNGEIAFFKTYTGDLISKTNKNPLYGAGGNPIFNDVDHLLYDCTWQGELIAWGIDPLNKVFTHTYKNHLITIMCRNTNNRDFYAAVTPNVYAPMHGGSKLLRFSTLNENYDPEYLTPKEKELMDSHGNWKSIEAMDFNSSLILCLQPMGLIEPPTIVNYDVESGESKFIYLESQYQSVWSITSNSSVIVSVVKTNPYRKDMTHEERIEASKNAETDQIYIHDKNSLQKIAKIYWPKLNSVCFSPNGKSIAIASYSNSVYLADFQTLLTELTSC